MWFSRIVLQHDPPPVMLANPARGLPCVAPLSRREWRSSSCRPTPSAIALRCWMTIWQARSNAQRHGDARRCRSPRCSAWPARRGWSCWRCESDTAVRPPRPTAGCRTCVLLPPPLRPRRAEEGHIVHPEAAGGADPAADGRAVQPAGEAEGGRAARGFGEERAWKGGALWAKAAACRFGGPAAGVVELATRRIGFRWRKPWGFDPPPAWAELPPPAVALAERGQDRTRCRLSRSPTKA